jgi:hypothetical protein
LCAHWNCTDDEESERCLRMDITWNIKRVANQDSYLSEKLNFFIISIAQFSKKIQSCLKKYFGNS